MLLCIMLLGGLGYALASQQTPRYNAATTILVVSAETETSNQYSSLQTSLGLTETYRQLIHTGPVLDRVVRDLDLPYSDVELTKNLTTAYIPDTQLIRITVTDTDPSQAARIANSIASHFQDYVSDTVNPELGAQIRIADPARIPDIPFEPRPVFWLALGMFAGGLLGIGVIAVAEFVDNTVKPEQNFQALVGAPLLASVPKANISSDNHDQLFVLQNPRSAASEVLRVLRTNLEFAAAADPIRILSISSPGPGEGKSTIAANLAIVMAQAGMKTVLIDADLRKPSQHEIFSVSNRKGLTTLLMRPESSWEWIAAGTPGVPNLSIITSGPIPPNPTDLLQMNRFSELIKQVSADAELVLIDTPPILAVADPLTVAKRTDGIVLVCQSGKTRTDAFRQAAHAIRQGNLRLAGIVLNRSRQSDSHYYHGYYGGEYGSAQAETSLSASAVVGATPPMASD